VSRSAFLSRSAEETTFYCELKQYALDHGYKLGWTAHKFKERFGTWPSGLEHLSPITPTRSTLNWIRSRQIAWARSQTRRMM
jgi:hypothetical protein